MNSELKNEKQKLLDKIRKLLALSKDPANEHEAAAAGEKARQLLEEYNLTVGEVDLKATEPTEERILLGRKPLPYQDILSHACESLFEVAAVAVRVERWMEPAQSFMAFLGVPQNVGAAVLTFNHFIGSIRSMAADRGRSLVKPGKRSQRMNRFRLDSYRLGAARRILNEAEDLRSSAPEPDEKKDAIVLIGRAIAKRFVERKYPNLRRVRVPRLKVDREAFHMGFRDGGKVTLHAHKQIGAAEAPSQWP